MPFEFNLNSLLLSLLGNMESAVRSVMNAIKQWERKTCLRFVPRTNEKAYLLWSSLRTRGEIQFTCKSG